MRSIIDGTRFHTDTARLICEVEGLGPRGAADPATWVAGLYALPRTPRLFIAGRGGPMTVFAPRAGRDGWSPGERIIPVTREAAVEWLGLVAPHRPELIERLDRVVPPDA